MPASSVQMLGSMSPGSQSPKSVNRLVRTGSNRYRSGSAAPGTFAPSFIGSSDLQKSRQKISHIEGENDFSGKRYVWLKDADKAFVKGWIVEDLEGSKVLVQCDDGTQRTVNAEDTDKVNPAKFDNASDMAELTYLNEASVVHNLHTRYQSDLIYTYSGLFLVTINPYCPLSIYSREHINMYRGRTREEARPHIFAVADEAFRNLVDENRNQSILVTGESGAGKTENTKKVIQYLAAVASFDQPTSRAAQKGRSNLSQQILRANPILESFGNAQTVRNNNSSRFGKFIRIQFTSSGQIAGASIDWYLLEKSRVVKNSPQERNYHIFYQLLKGADDFLKRKLLLDGLDVEDFEYTKHGNDMIAGISDENEWNALIEALQVMGFSDHEQESIFRTVAAVLYLGNIKVVKESLRADQATLNEEGRNQARKACSLLNIPYEAFESGVLRPRVKAGREWVQKVQTPEQVKQSIDALAKGIYERSFGDLVSKINAQLDRSSVIQDDTFYIGVLDIAGFEIFEENSFEQLCINYTNEKLQQFFNHHMFVLEQDEYAREQIDWSFIDFGQDLQPTIDLIELSNPIGIFSCLDEDSVMPKATDKSFTEKLHSLWDRKTPRYKQSMLHQGFMLTHYAAEVEYSTEGWLEKNKDPLNDNVTKLLAASSDKHLARLFEDCAEDDDELYSSKNRVKKGLFRTVAQKHKEQLSSLMTQLHSTHPHFVRCILPNHKKRPKLFDANLVLDQLRCNGVLEGIRIARTGFPNRIPFAEFRARYEVLCSDLPRGYLDGAAIAKVILDKLALEPSHFRIGLTKVFFRAGVLAELEEKRDALISDIISRFQALAKAYVQRRSTNKKLYRAEAARVIQRNFAAYQALQSNPWWNLFLRTRPLLGATKHNGELRKRDEKIQQLRDQMKQSSEEKQKIDDERRRGEQEIEKITNILQSERALALDKEAIFQRLQDRKIELEESLRIAEEAHNRSSRESEEHKNSVTHQKQLVTQLREELKSSKQSESDGWRQLEEERKRTNEKFTNEQSQAQKDVRALRSQLDQLQAWADSEHSRLRTQIDHTRQEAESQRANVEEANKRLDTESRATKRKLDETIAQHKSDEQRHKQIFDEHQNHMLELKSLQNTLESERHSSLSKDSRIKQLEASHSQLSEKLKNAPTDTTELKALKEREVELSSKLAGALEDQENLETTIDELMAAKKRAEDDSRKIRKELEQAGSLVASLEKEKSSLFSQRAGLKGRVTELEMAAAAAKANGEDERTRLAKENDRYKSQISNYQRERADLIRQNDWLSDQQSTADTDIRHMNGDSRQSGSPASSLQHDIARLQKANAELTKQIQDRAVSNSEQKEIQKQKEALQAQLHAAQSHNTTLSTQGTRLQSQIKSLQQELSSLKTARGSPSSQRAGINSGAGARNSMYSSPKATPEPLSENPNLSNSPRTTWQQQQQTQQQVSSLQSQVEALKRESTHKDDELSAVENENKLLREQLARVYGRDPQTVFDDLNRAKSSLERMERELEAWKGLRVGRKSSVRSARSVSIGSADDEGARFV